MKFVLLSALVALAACSLPYPLTDSTHVKDISISFALSHRYVISLKSSNTEFLASELNKISDPSHPRYGEQWDLERIRKYSDAPLDQRNQVIDWLVSKGFSHIRDWGDSISFVAPEGLTQAYTHLLKNGLELDDNTKRVLSSDLAGLGVVAVEGKGMGIPSVVNRLKQRVKRVEANPNFAPGIVGRQSLEYIYNITDNVVSPLHTNQTSVCSCEYQSDQGFSRLGLAHAQYYNDFEKNPIAADHIVGGDNGVDDESQLDVQIMQSVLGGQINWFWVVTGWLHMMAAEVLNHKTPPYILSNSWGWASDEQCQITTCGIGGDHEYVARANAEYVKLGLRRITFLAAAGDAGAPGRTNENCDEVRGVVPIFPGASPYVLTIGGTYNSGLHGEVSLDKVTSPTKLCNGDKLLNPSGCANGTTEGVTNYAETFLPIQWTAGGGFGFGFESPAGTPAYQQSFVDEYLKSGVKFPHKFNRTGRVYPDVSANSNNCAVFNDDGSLNPGAGTSCATPIVAAILTLINWDLEKMHKSPIGYANNFLYTLAKDHPTAFHKPQLSNNHCTEEQCCAVREGVSLGYFSNPKVGGFDAVTGLGTPNVKEWRQYVQEIWARREKQ